MTAKQLDGGYAPDGSKYATHAAAGTVVPTTTADAATAKQLAIGAQAPDGSIYFTLTDGSGTLV